MGTRTLTKLSFLDRLLGFGLSDECDRSGVAVSSMASLEGGLIRDLEWLLNTPQASDPLRVPCDELSRSLYAYGFPDVASMTQHAGLDQELARAIENAIALFEPRLRGVTVTASPALKPGNRRFVLSAFVTAEPAPHRVLMDASLDLGTHRFSVGGSQDA